MKKHSSLLLLLGLSLITASTAIQCKHADSKASEAEITSDSLTETSAIITPDTIAPAPAESEPAPAPVTKTDPKAKPETKTDVSPKPEPKPTTDATPKPESKTTTAPAPKPNEESVPAPPENKADKDVKKPEPATTAVLTDFSAKSAKGLIKGTSNLHDWEMDINKMECKGSIQSKDNTIQAIKNVEVKIRVENIKSEEGKIMDEKTYKAFHADKNPMITYTFSNADVKYDGAGAFTITAAGSLSMAGTTKPVSITAKGKVLANGDLQISVSKKIKMTEFKMEPPTALMGTIKVGDEVSVSFDLVLSH